MVFGKKYSNKFKKSSKNRGESNLRTSKADGIPEAAKRIERVLTTNPGMGIIRHADADYEEAIELAEKNGVKIPMMR